jgi:hypothetical protein
MTMASRMRASGIFAPLICGATAEKAVENLLLGLRQKEQSRKI